MNIIIYTADQYTGRNGMRKRTNVFFLFFLLFSLSFRLLKFMSQLVNIVFIKKYLFPLLLRYKLEIVGGMGPTVGKVGI